MKYLLIFSLFFSTTTIAAEPSFAGRVLEIVRMFLDNELSERQFSERILSLKQDMGEENKVLVYEVCSEPQAVVSSPSDYCPSITPGFNCGSARTPTDRAICADQQLKLYDLEMSFLYFKKISNGIITKEQKAWQRRRNSCGADVACLSKVYQERISQLK
jgi:uncharacterized protein YecT (DUF1311 family)